MYPNMLETHVFLSCMHDSTIIALKMQHLVQLDVHGVADAVNPPAEHKSVLNLHQSSCGIWLLLFFTSIIHSLSWHQATDGT